MHRWVALVLALVAVSVAGCGGSGDDPPEPDSPLPKFTTVAQLTRATFEQRKADGTAQFHISGVSSGTSAQSMTGDGALKFVGDNIAMRVGQQLQELNKPPGPLFTLVIVPDGAFLKLPDSASGMLPPGKSWFRIQDNTTSPAMQQFSQAVQTLRQNADPTQGFNQLGNAVSITESSQEALDNVWTVRYKISLDLAKAAQLTTDFDIKDTLDYLVQAGARTEDTTLWLDARNRLLRMVLVRNLPTDNGVTTYTLTTRYRDWGEPVDISAPPAEQVVSN
ncbi:hypothetical protein [Pseudonocardia spinosispora]|uniref:hypothetical protein n=1 Tax=Pseudonocardia spinosispora TaxID=103441 RepID=UPI00040088C7|nr:hypothetical protein [Pseudonocardia spinosispora]